MFGKQPRKVDDLTPCSKEDDYWPEAVSLLTDVKFIQDRKHEASNSQQTEKVCST